MPFFFVTGAYIDPGEGPVESYHWEGEALNREDAERLMQEECHQQYGSEPDERDDPLLDVIDVWGIHPDDVEAHVHGPADAYIRMRLVL